MQHPTRHTQRVLSSPYGVSRFTRWSLPSMISGGVLCRMEPDEIIIAALAVIVVVAIVAMAML